MGDPDTLEGGGPPGHGGVVLMAVYHKKPERQENKFFDVKQQRFYVVPRLSRQNPYQQRRLTERLADQLDEESVSSYSRMHHEHWRVYQKTLNRRGIRHRTLHLAKWMIVLSTLGNHELPDDPVKRNELLTEWIAAMTKGKKFGGTRTFGGKYKGFRFPPPEPGRYILLGDEAELEYVAAILNQDKVKWHKNGENIIIDEMDEKEAEEYVYDRFVPVWRQLGKLSKELSPYIDYSPT